MPFFIKHVTHGCFELQCHIEDIKELNQRGIPCDLRNTKLFQMGGAWKLGFSFLDCSMKMRKHIEWEWYHCYSQTMERPGFPDRRKNVLFAVVVGVRAHRDWGLLQKWAISIPVISSAQLLMICMRPEDSPLTWVLLKELVKLYRMLSPNYNTAWTWGSLLNS